VPAAILVGLFGGIAQQFQVIGGYRNPIFTVNALRPDASLNAVKVVDTPLASASTVQAVEAAPLVVVPPIVGIPNQLTGAIFGALGISDPSGSKLTYTITGTPVHGALSVWSDGSFTYTPSAAARLAAGVAGAPASATTDTFTVSATNGVYSTTQTVTVAVSPIAAPVIAAPTVGTPDLPTGGAVYGKINATDPFGYKLTYTATDTPVHGTLTVNASTGSFTYTPSAAARLTTGVAGVPPTGITDTFKVTVSDGSLSTSQTVTVPVSPILVTDNSVTAAETYGWGTPTSSTDFTSWASLDGWRIYNGPDALGFGTRTPTAISFNDNTMTFTGDAQGNTAGIASQTNQTYGRWEVSARFADGSANYHPVILLWPASDSTSGGEVDFGENQGDRQILHAALHYAPTTVQDPGQEWSDIAIDTTQWHNYAVEWTPDKITYYIDGVPWYSTTNTQDFPSGPVHLALQLDDFGGDISQGGQMQVAWAHVYSL